MSGLARVGFVGLGMMGQGMARNLLAKGFPLAVVAHRNRVPLERLATQGAAVAADPKALAEQSDIVVLCVTGSPAVEETVYRTGGLLEAARQGLVIVDCSTSEPGSTLRIAADLAARGAELADAPLARTPAEAESGRLNAMVGASDAAFARIRPVLAAFCENIWHVGPTGTGHTAKLVYNFLAMGQAALIAEALVACAATGLDVGRFAEIVSAGGANSGIFQLIVPKAQAGDYSGLRFGLANAAKDLGYYTHMTDQAGLVGPLGHAVRQALVAGLKLGFADGYVGDLIRAQARLNRIDGFAA